MDTNPEKKEQTIRLRLTNEQDVDMEFALEPRGMGLFIPPKTTLEVIIPQQEEDIEIVFKNNYFSIYTDYHDDFPKVLQNKIQIEPLEIEEIFSEFKMLEQEVLSSSGKTVSITDIILTHDQRRILMNYMTVLHNSGMDEFKTRASEFDLTDEEIAVLDALVEKKAYVLKPSEGVN